MAGWVDAALALEAVQTPRQDAFKGYRALVAAAIVGKALQDAERPDRAAEVQEFFASPLGGLWLSWLGLDQQVVLGRFGSAEDREDREDAVLEKPA